MVLAYCALVSPIVLAVYIYEMDYVTAPYYRWDKDTVHGGGTGSWGGWPTTSYEHSHCDEDGENCQLVLLPASHSQSYRDPQPPPPLTICASSVVPYYASLHRTTSAAWVCAYTPANACAFPTENVSMASIRRPASAPTQIQAPRME
jgi:hypothetical protein